MSGDSRTSRASLQRPTSATPVLLQSCSLFADPPVALPNLDELRAADVLVHAYYGTLAKTSLPPSPPFTSLSVQSGASPLDAGGAKHGPDPLPPPSAYPASVVAEATTVGEVIGASLAREVVEAAANLYTSRRLDDLVETYTACATWDDARDVVASAFLPQDVRGNGLSSEPARANAEVPVQDAPQREQLLGASAQSLPTPVFMRSALSLAGVTTRTLTSILTPQSSLYPPPLGTTLPVRCATHDTTGPTPPPSVPMDAFSRYVLLVEEVPPPTAAADRPRSPLRGSPPRPRATRSKAKSAERSTPAAAAAALSPSPPVTVNAPGKRSTRRSQRRSLQPLQASSLPEPASSRGKISFSPTAQTPPEDPLTRALRQGLFSATVDGAPGAVKAERPPARPAVTGVGLSSSSFPSIMGGNDTLKKVAGKQALRAAGVIAVEQDRLWTTDRGGKSQPRGGQHKDAVRCHVVPNEEDDASKLAQEDEVAVVNEGSAHAAEAERDQRGKGGSRRAPLSNTAKSAAAAAKTKKALTAEREAWTASFFSATDAAGEAPLQDQVQVMPSPGVKVVGGAFSPTAAQTTRRGHKGAAAGANTMMDGGDFTVPADRMALSAFDEKRVAVRKPNGPGRITSPRKPRQVQAFKTM
ncbi:hypothetical protein ABB37_01047 [Leptomonas pyrrhocoris]|uniref:Uncharacterized protein n=1 Tax=Leptomonas pyrrhocoris TaxID=157538 RepID=A0A0N0VH67_LEPPY|nr:hypothetical protein ABB37_01047 [Leptomonas pyrrhocoris]XP_015662937.1 hypothetical protein ABB37_01047 [Leptomonas pyrrhocoris]KPA84497.1 hypothetical protein ABB37_01047 [Leptomonas pyrrhocoris]KPA84498.1 hypothetical protein ABB37_01047 [Leptomonas pyrrhocoris]|eukprot:XP_015662936.1 hypothetical protein ABB37_01047 [Leptomonas pyrrhocoris]